MKLRGDIRDRDFKAIVDRVVSDRIVMAMITDELSEWEISIDGNDMLLGSKVGALLLAHVESCGIDLKSREMIISNNN